MINIDTGHYYIVLAECDTGIVLDSNGERNISGKTPYIAFDNLEAAEGYSFQKISELPHIECNIYNDKSEFIKVITKK